MESARRLTDEELLNREFTTLDPASLPGLSAEPPRDNEPLFFLMEYHLGSDEAPVQCCACERKTDHWHGFVIQAGATKHLIGSVCGPKHYGLSFKQGRTTFKAAASRIRYLTRALELKIRSETLLGYPPSANDVSNIVLVERQLKGLAPALYRELRDLVSRGDPFSVTERVRDYERERRSKSESPIYTSVRSPLGPVNGSGLIRAETLTRTFDARRRALVGLFHAIDSGTNHIDDRKLVSLLGMVEHENAKATEAVRALNSVADFFSSDNLAHLHAWQRPFGLKNFG